MRQIATAKLIPGMIIAKDVYTHDDQLILPEGFSLTDRTITKLAYYTIPFVFIKDNSEIKSKSAIPVPEEAPRSA